MRDAKYSGLVWKLLSPLAESVGLDIDVETTRPVNTPAQLAYAFVSCGGVLLVDSADPAAVPSGVKGTRKRVAKAVARSLDRQGAREAAVFLAHAYAIDLYEFFRFRGDQAAADRHLGFQQLIQEHFPLSNELITRLEATRAEFRTLETHEVRDQVRTWDEIGTGYSRALLDPDLLDGRDPDDDEELVEIQKRYAGSFLRWHARLVAIELTIGREDFAAVEDNLMFPGGPFGLEGLTFAQLEDVRWANRGEMWRHHGERALGFTLPEDDQLDVELVDPTAALLGDEIARWLEMEHLAPLPERSQQALAHFANDIAANEPEWGIATDALLMGYGLRVAERALLNEITGFDEGTIVRLNESVADAPDTALVGFALNVANDLPAPFGESAGCWAQLSAWAARRALDRAQARRNAGMELGDAITINAKDCERAVGLGYGVRYVEEALDPSRANTADRPSELAVGFDPIEVSSTDTRSAAVDLLTRTEGIFVELGAPGPIALLITTVSLKGRYDADEAHPQYGVLLAVTLFGYATRMAQAERAPLPSQEVAQIERWITRNNDGTVDHLSMSDKPEALHQLGKHAGALADDRIGLFTLLRTPLEVWTHFHRLATQQLYRNLRQNGIKRRLHPPPDAIENLIRLGCALRIIEEVAGESPRLKSEFGYG